MKQNIALITLIISFSSFCSEIKSQNDSVNIAQNNIEFINNSVRNYVIKYKKETYIVDSVYVRQLNPQWILKIEILKDKKCCELYDNLIKDSTVLIYIKSNYIKQAKDMIDNYKKKE